ncbi:MAG: hypothetical protein WCJ40_09975 [Planctomycetota bacterium]|nr:hypothetical protein [Planctomycetota bacterium]
MFDHVATMNEMKLTVVKRNLLCIAADEPDFCQSSLIQPFSGQDQPAHGHIKPDGFEIRACKSGLNQGGTGAATDIKKAI